MYHFLVIFSCVVLTATKCPPCTLTSREEIGTCLVCESSESKENIEFPGYDGWYNNLGKPDMGATDRPLLRRWPADYEDGTYLPAGSDRPNPLTLSDKIFKATEEGVSKTGKSVLLVYYGQQVLQEIMDINRPACPPEYFNIPIPENHTYQSTVGHTQMPFLRTRFDQRTGQNPSNPRQQLNGMTPFIDGGVIYGTSKQWSDELRINSDGSMKVNGQLASSSEGFPEFNTNGLPLMNMPPPALYNEIVNNRELLKGNRFFKIGNLRGNESPFLLSLSILWFRWHNYLAQNIKELNQNWSGDRIFNEARKWVIATQQQITFYEWLPDLLDNTVVPPYTGYNPSIDPQIDQFFATTASHFGDTLVTSYVYFRDFGKNGCQIFSPNKMRKNLVRTCNSYWRPEYPILTWHDDNEMEYIGIDRVLMGMAYQISEREDHQVVDDLRGSYYGPLHFPRRDLMALIVQRGRDHGLPDYNSARKAYSLPKVESFEKLTEDKQIQEVLKELYANNIDNIDAWVGGILETKNGPGELFEKIISDQFLRIRDGDRFWFENTNNGLFTAKEISMIKSLKLKDIIKAVTEIDDQDLQTRVFHVPIGTEVHPSCSNLMINGTCNTVKCAYLPSPNSPNGEQCTAGGTYDYFKTSETPFILSLLFLLITILGVYVLILILIKIKNVREQKKKQPKIEDVGDTNRIQANEWLSSKKSRQILLSFNQKMRLIEILSIDGVHLRSIFCSGNMSIYKTTDQPTLLIIRPEKGYDLVLSFTTDFLRRSLEAQLNLFFDTFRPLVSEEKICYKEALNEIISEEKREKQLNRFIRVICAQAFHMELSRDKLAEGSVDDGEILRIKLSLHEFAKIINMDPKSDFLKLLFRSVDKDKSECISFKELLEFFAIFSIGSPKERAQKIFKIYDIDNKDELSMESFKEMIKSLFQNIQASVSAEDLDNTIMNMLRDCGLDRQEKVTPDNFVKFLGDKLDMLKDVNLDINGGSRVNKMRKTINSIYGDITEIKEVFNESEHLELITPEAKNSLSLSLVRYIQKYCKEIFWMTLYTSILLGIFAQNIYDLAFEKEHTGLRRIAGYGVAVSRASATAMMITFSSLLVTMCRNFITILRDTFANKYFPFDSSVEIHKYIAYWALFFSILHILGHTVNFYHISTQTPDDLGCLFRNNFHASHELPTFTYWLWGTMAGVTGIILTVIGAIIYLFALPIVRRKIFNWFWFAHSLYPLFFIFTALHGSGRVIKEQIFYQYFFWPGLLFIIDQIISISRRKIKLSVVNAKILPSDVTALEITKPPGFEYKSGQWLKIACLSLNSQEFHPFTISSSPNEDIISVHIRSVGPWTKNLRKVYKQAVEENSKPLPQIYLDGPFGEGHQDWYKYNVSILIGGGIGVTPFASILKDIAFKARGNQVKIKKVYFLWVSKTQKEFEWLVDVLSEIEKTDSNGVINCHIYITQFADKYDIRTVLLHIFERNFHRTSKKSLFTNLGAVTHFGRPKFKRIFRTVQSLHLNKVSEIGVFSCGGPMMIKSIDEACIACSKCSEELPVLEHHFNTF